MRQREREQTRCSCKALLDSMPLDRLGERYCAKCEPTRKVYCSFFVRGQDQWVVQFLKPDLRTPIGRMRTFGSPDKLREMIARTPTKMILENRHSFVYAITTGRGSVWLMLTPEQYGKLRP